MVHSLRALLSVLPVLSSFTHFPQVAHALQPSHLWPSSIVQCGDVGTNDKDQTPPFATPSLVTPLRSLITVNAYIHDNQLPYQQQRQDSARTNEPECHQGY